MGNKKSKHQKNQRVKSPQESASPETDTDEFESEAALFPETQFNAAFRHRQARTAPTKQVIDPKLLASEKYEIFRDPQVAQQFEQAKIQIVDAISMAGGKISIFKGLFDTTFVAIKMVNLQGMDDAQKYHQKSDRELREILRHRNIIRCHYIAQFETKYFLVLEFAEKGSIREIIDENGPMSESLAMAIFVEVCKALWYMHKKIGFAHRNLRLENILLTRNQIPKVTDFKYGISFDGQNLINTYCGWIPYLATEVLLGKPYNPFPADVWALGVCLFVMVNDSLPYRSGNQRNYIEEHEKHAIQFRSFMLEEASEDLVLLIKRILEPKIKSRHTLRTLRGDTYVQSFKNKNKP